MKKICAITMVRNDEFYLRKWVEYYGAQLGRENLRVFFDTSPLGPSISSMSISYSFFMIPAMCRNT